MSNPLPTPGVKGRLFFSNGGDNGEACLVMGYRKFMETNSFG